MSLAHFLKDDLYNIHRTLIAHFNDVSEIGLNFEFKKLDLFELLKHVNCEKIFYFKSKYRDFSYLGLGHAKTIEGTKLQGHLQEYPEDYLIAALLFEASPIVSKFELPEWAFVTESGKTRLRIYKSFEYQNFSSPNLFFDTEENFAQANSEFPAWESYEEYPEHDQWTKMIDTSHELFKQNILKKIVLSRTKIFQYKEVLEPIIFFTELLQKNPAISSYAIFNQITFGKAFISLTPEKLFSIKNNQFESIALAASAPRGKTEQADRELEQTLYSSDKLTREHMIVTEEIVKRITPLTKKITIAPLETMKLPYIQHRSIPISAELKSDYGPLPLIDLLHPTPAIGGLPWEAAKDKLKELEPYKRDHYAAPIGIISKNDSEIAVGIRSAMIETNKITVFGGAGIVAGSDAEEEWNETGTKMNPFLKVINNV